MPCIDGAGVFFFNPYYVREIEAFLVRRKEMKIVRCPKGGKVPENYCRLSCLNYSPDHQTVRLRFLKKVRTVFFRRERDVSRSRKEEIAY
jgi:hypothetical protein